MLAYSDPARQPHPPSRPDRLASLSGLPDCRAHALPLPHKALAPRLTNGEGREDEARERGREKAPRCPRRVLQSTAKDKSGRALKLWRIPSVDCVDCVPDTINRGNAPMKKPYKCMTDEELAKEVEEINETMLKGLSEIAALHLRREAERPAVG